MVTSLNNSTSDIKKEMCSARHCKGVLTSKECQVVLGYIEALNLNKVRSDILSKVDQVILERSPENDWLYKKVQETLLKINDEYYQFEVVGLEDIQLLEYHFLHYMHPHFDCFTPSTSDRKLVISIQIGPDRYLGGNLFVRAAEGLIRASRNDGDALVFPAYLQHFVSRIFFGKRTSLVCRLRGKNDLQ